MEISTKNHQRGGMLQALIGDWTSRTIDCGSDPSGLSRWSYIKVQGRNDQQFILLSGYRICGNQTIDMGSNNTFNQQYRILHQQGQQNPDPKSSFLDDLIPIINNWRAQKKAVLICIDANENIHKPKSTSMARLFQETDLIDLHHH